MFQKIMTNVQESFEFLAEKAKQEFQNNLSALLESIGMLQSKAANAKGNGKNGYWITTSEAEIITSHLLEISGNLSGNYKVLHETNLIVNANYGAAMRLIKGDIRTAIKRFQEDEINKEELDSAFNKWLTVNRPMVA
jgi:hypothetical protein